ncbi:MAG: RdgB/HAM1 family non-canonical purine NTP pyrophosphatase [Candidatus Korarchaeota archaeon]
MKLTILTSNIHKFNEISAILKPLTLEMKASEKIEIQVDSTNPEALDIVALYSAATARINTRPPYALEDTGLFIRALGGFPGIYSHYVKDTIGPNGILKLMEGVEDRYAEFRATVALVLDDTVRLFRGTAIGNIANECRGSGGFGFDPIFEYNGKTFAEMHIEEKIKVSHRGEAWRKMRDWILTVL